MTNPGDLLAAGGRSLGLTPDQVEAIVTTPETKVKPGRPKGTPNLTKPPPACAKCQGQLRRDMSCYQCGASPDQALGRPAGWVAPISAEEMKSRARRSNGRPRLADEIVWGLRRDFRESSQTLRAFCKERSEKDKIAQEAIRKAVRGFGCYADV